MDNKANFSPKAFLKERRPERFSDSIVVETGALDRPQLEYYLATLNTRSQELEFETFSKRLCEKIICPNLLEQTGPVAGGDGKTDTQTFPVSEQNQLLWYEGINDSSHKERWAFGVSTRKDWKSKCKEDVKKIVGTGRGYVRAFCITNQSVKSDQRSKVEDSLSNEFDIQVTILDLSWILDQIFKNNLQQLAIESLNIPTQYTRTIELSANDYKKQQELERLNRLINETVEAHDISSHQVSYFLDVAILSKELEKPSYETQSLFDRAVRIADRFGSNQQAIDAYYQYAWASYWWFEDFHMFEQNLENVYNRLIDSSNSSKWESLVTLLNVHQGHSRIAKVSSSIDIQQITTTTKKRLLEISLDEGRPSNSLSAKILACQLKLIDKVYESAELNSIFAQLMSICSEGEGLIGFPFEVTFNTFSELDSLFSEIEEYENLMDYLTEQSVTRSGEVQTSLLALKRGLKRLDSGKPYEAIKLIGKSLSGLNKKETINDFVIANFALSCAYSDVGLLWASRASLLFAASLLTDRYWKKDDITPMAVKSYWRLAWAELKLGRIAHSLKWFELALMTEQCLAEECINPDEITTFDGCLCHLLLNCSLKDLVEFEYLPDVLDKFSLYGSYGALLYILGYEDEFVAQFEQEIDKEHIDFLLMARDVDIGHKTSKLRKTLGKRSQIGTKVLGCEVNINFPNRSPLIEMAESILSSLEGFFSTGIADRLYAQVPLLNISLVSDDDDDHLISHELSRTSSRSEFEITCSNFSWESLSLKDRELIQEWFVKFVIECLCQICILENTKPILEKMLRDDLALSRSISFEICFGSVYNILGKNAYADTVAILNSSAGKRFAVKRDTPWDLSQPKQDIHNNTEHNLKVGNENNRPKDEDRIDSIGHDQIKITSLIKPNLWDAAQWHGLGFITIPNQPPFIMLVFKSPQGGIELFKDLYKEIGAVDKSERLRVSIIRGVSRSAPYHYRVQIGENPQLYGDAKYLTMISRIHEMTPNDDQNWSRFEQAFSEYGEYRLGFGIFDDGAFIPVQNFETISIAKKEMVIKNAWAVGPNDFECSTIYEDDEPIVPKGASSPPYIETIKKFRSFGK
ncbi:hypothetical protein C4G53_RS03285 [Vibrio parahaemolyticus]|uniref:hypothetical protein n=1 Tax=Vibrio parahaemolyticus TaxID=670 RepID=UPI001B81346C|nr:hypothetical protein [Vibrio parahaemolyticus]EGR2290122.1 hypothetical protein [Vibrio parahaemolyticus]EJG1082771.1 hypothetical protein [Vibrio parahaemolyticus]ELA9361347.1 hypothetical protein [Vibrio parahaemolyticus]MCC3855334.1 hypothetical protein [Vibrio parahaemolyticus]HBC3956784.1 hypothetical protein [Vibrio parahaemolyticus]